MESIKTALLAASIPSALFSFMIWMMKQKLTKSEKEREEKEKRQEKLQLIILDSVNASIRLAKASAKAIQRIPDAHCNGDMTSALEDIEEAQRKQQQLIAAAGIHDIMHD